MTKGLAIVFLAACGHAASSGPEGEPPADPIADVAPDELFRRGLALAQRGDLIRAEQYLAAAIERGYPRDRGLPILLRVCVASSRLTTALDYARPYLEEHPEDWPLRHLVASIHLGLGHPDDARRELERVIADAPNEAEPHYLLAVVLRDELGDVDGARPHFQRYLELAPEGRRAAEVSRALEIVAVTREPTREPTPETPEVTE